MQVKIFVTMQHRGEIVERAIRQSGYPISSIAKKLGKSRRWMYLMFDKYLKLLEDYNELLKKTNEK